MKRIIGIIMCLICLAGCGEAPSVSEPVPTSEPTPEPVVVENTPAETIRPTSAIVEQAADNADEVAAVEAMRKVWNFEEGCLTEDADRAKLEVALELAARLEDGEMKENLYVMIHAVGEQLREVEVIETEEGQPDIEVRNMRLYGTCLITHYCSCSKCCNEWAGGPTASGVMPTIGRTVAMDLPFGTQIMVGDTLYVVEDRGVSGMKVDIYCSSHEEALNRGMYYAEVYIVE